MPMQNDNSLPNEGDVIEGEATPQSDASSAPSRLPRYPSRTSAGSAPAEGSIIEETPKPKIGVGEDVARSIAAQGTLGAAADLPTTLQTMGDVSKELTNKFVDYALQKANPDVVNKTKQALDLISQINPVTRTANLLKNIGSYYGVDFTQPGMQRIVQEKLPFTQYEPQTDVGKMAGTAARVAVPAMLTEGVGPLISETSAIGKTLGSLRGVARGAVTGTAAGVGSEVAGTVAHQLLPETPSAEAIARLAGAIGSGATASKIVDAVGYLSMPNAVAEQKILDSLSSEFRNGSSNMTIEEYNNAIKNGQEPTIFDMAGDTTRSLLKRYGYLNSDVEAKVGALKKAMEARRDAASSNVSNHIDNIFGSEGPGELDKKIRSLNKENVDKLYTLARTDPKAASVWSPELEKLSGIDDIKTAGKDAERSGTDPKLNIISYRRGTADQVVPSSILDESGNPASYTTIPGSPPQYPNLNYWHRVKTYIGDELRTATGQRRKDLTDLQNRLVNAIDKEVPSYATARDAASEAFGESNAIEAGQSAIRKMNDFDSTEFIDNYRKLNPEQRKLFAQGAAGALRTKLQNDPNALDWMLRNLNTPAVSQRMKMALGEDNFNSIMGKAVTEDMLSKVKLPDPVTGAPKISMGTLVGGGVGGPLLGFAGYDTLMKILHGHLPSIGAAAIGSGGLVSALAAKGVYNFAESRIASKVVDLMSDPSKAAELGKLAATNPNARSFIDKTAKAIKDASIRGQSLLPSQYMLPPDESSKPKITQQSSGSFDPNDLMTRTILAEAGGEPDTGKAAVAHVILNRAKSSGESIPDVINRPNAFESVGNGSVNSVDPNSKNYQHIKNDIVIPAMRGDLQDPTSGATHFINKSEMKRRGDPIPNWAQGKGTQIGNHTFFNLPYDAPHKIAQQSFGGRIERASGGRADNHEQLVNRLLRLADQAKKATDKTTEPLLDAPDEHIVGALKVAQEAI